MVWSLEDILAGPRSAIWPRYSNFVRQMVLNHQLWLMSIIVSSPYSVSQRTINDIPQGAPLHVTREVVKEDVEATVQINAMVVDAAMRRHDEIRRQPNRMLGR